MDKLATRRGRKAWFRRQTLQTIGARKATLLVDHACNCIWPLNPDYKGSKEAWRKIWYPQLEQAFRPGFVYDFLTFLKITPDDLQKLELLGGPHGRTIYKALMARKTNE